MYEVERLVVKIVGDASAFNNTMDGVLRNMSYLSQKTLAANEATYARLVSSHSVAMSKLTQLNARYNQNLQAQQNAVVGTAQHQQLLRQEQTLRNQIGLWGNKSNSIQNSINSYNSLSARSVRYFHQARVAIIESIFWFGQLGQQMTRVFTMPFLVLGGLSTYIFAKFDNALTKAMAVMNTTNVGTRNDLSNAAINVAMGSGKKLTDIADSYYYLASAGYDAQRSIAVLPIIENFATASGISMQQSTELLTESLQSLGMASKDAEENMKNMLRLSNAIVEANNLSSASAKEFAIALENKFGAALRLTNKSVEEGLAVLAAYAQQGIQGRVAGEFGSRMLRDLQTAAIKNASAWEDLKISAYDATGQMLKVWEIVAQLERVMAKATDQQKKEVLLLMGMTDRAANATISLMGTSKAMKDYYDKLQNVEGVSERVANQMKKSLSVQLEILANRFRILGVQFGSALAPTLIKLSTLLMGLATWFMKLDPATKELIVNIGLLVSVIGPLLIVSVSLINLFATLIGLAGWPGIVAIGLVALTLSFINLDRLSQQFGGSWSRVWRQIKDDIISGDIENAFRTLGLQLKLGWNLILNDIARSVDRIAKGMQLSLERVGNWLEEFTRSASVSSATSFANRIYEKHLAEMKASTKDIDYVGVNKARSSVDKATEARTLLMGVYSPWEVAMMGLQGVINKRDLRQSMRVAEQMKFNLFDESFKIPGMKIGQRSLWDLIMGSIGLRGSGLAASRESQFSRSALGALGPNRTPEKGFFEMLFGASTVGDPALQAIIDANRSKSQAQFEAIDLRRFVLEGPGGLATTPSSTRPQEVFSPSIEGRLDVLNDQLKEKNAFNRERIDD